MSLTKNGVLVIGLVGLALCQSAISSAQTAQRVTPSRVMAPVRIESLAPDKTRLNLTFGDPATETVRLEATEFAVQQEKDGITFETFQPVTVTGTTSERSALWKDGVKVLVKPDGQVSWYIKLPPEPKLQ